MYVWRTRRAFARGDYGQRAKLAGAVGEVLVDAKVGQRGFFRNPLSIVFGAPIVFAFIHHFEWRVRLSR